jgi:hypothetical protein
VIGFANELPGITPETMRTLIAGARQKGRSWDEIGRRLDMTADKAERSYRALSEIDGSHRSGDWRHILAAILRQYKHPGKRGLVTVSGKPSDDLHPKTRDSILRQAGLNEDGSQAEQAGMGES